MLRHSATLARRQSPLALTTTHAQRLCNSSVSYPSAALKRKLSTSNNGGDQWPSTHPQKERLKQIQNAMQGKDPHAASSQSGKGAAPEPTRRELYIVALHQAIPFVGFGIMDNAILLLAGEAIDVYLGVTLGISTMCAAAIGNIISDLSGVAFGTMIEDALIGWSKKIESWTKGRVKLPPMPNLSYEQRNLRSVRWSSQLGCAAGLTIGCIVGMFPLLFFPGDDRTKEENGGGEGSSSVKLINEENEQLKKDVTQWREKHAETIQRLKVLEREKNDRLWERGY
ncbi:hypothetical protein ACHAXT_008881 [Thalassiosira profunda]